jgi:hypothetical protein
MATIRVGDCFPSDLTRRVLVIDDTENILNLVERAALQLGCTVAALGNTLDFMTTFVRFKVRLYVLLLSR